MPYVYYFLTLRQHLNWSVLLSLYAILMDVKVNEL